MEIVNDRKDCVNIISALMFLHIITRTNMSNQKKGTQEKLESFGL